MTTPAAIDYSSRDYAAFRESMLTFAGVVLPDWRAASTGDPNDFGVALVEVFAYEGDILSYYSDRVANESFLSTATQRASVLAHAALLDYSPRAATAASVDLVFTVTSSVALTIPTGFRVATLSDTGSIVTFETTTELTFAGGPVESKTVAAVEGTLTADETIGISTGAIDQAFTLGQTPVVSNTLQVRVVEDPMTTGNVWLRVGNLLDADVGDNAYSTSVDEFGALTVHFGDGVNGRVPPLGSVVHASYRVGGGTVGNVLANALTAIVDASNIVYPDGPPGTPATVTVTNAVAAAGGSDSESLDSIRVNAPRALRTRDRAVSLADYETLALTVPSVQVAKAKAVSSVYTNVTLFIAPPGGGQPDQPTLQAVAAYLNARKLAPVSVVAATPVYVSVDISVTVDVDPRYGQFQVQQTVRNTLADLLSFDAVDFAARIPLSLVYAAVSRVPGVSNVIISRLAREDDSSPGVQDVILFDNELPLAGEFVVLTTGGVVNSDTGSDIVGTTSPALPTASGAPSVDASSCGANNSHFELSWTPGANTTSWDLEVDYLNGVLAIETLIVGPYTAPNAVLDLPLVGAGRADSVRFRTRAYNGSAGPVLSPPTTVAYTCG